MRMGAPPDACRSGRGPRGKPSTQAVHARTRFSRAWSDSSRSARSTLILIATRRHKNSGGVEGCGSIGLPGSSAGDGSA
jgi:hypothetical protein